MSTQTDLYGNTANIDPNEEFIAMYVRKNARNIYRQVKIIMNLPINEAAEVGIKTLIAILEKTNISEEDIQKIKDSKDIEEIANIIKNAFSI